MTEITVKIDGMMCGMCESHVNDTVRKAFPSINKVSSSHSKGTTTILTEQDITDDDLHKAIDPTGYIVLSVDRQPYRKKKGFLFFKK